MTTLENETHELQNNPFVSLRMLLGNSHIFEERPRDISIATLATAIEQSGIYTLDDYGRFRHFNKNEPKNQTALALLASIYRFENDYQPHHERHPLEETEGDPDDPYDNFGWETEDLPDFVSIRANQTEKIKRMISSSKRVESNILNIVAALLAYISGETKGIKKHQSYESDADLIRVIEAEYSVQAIGLHKRNLEKKFALAKLIFK